VSLSTTRMASLFGLDPATYRPHGLHAGERVYLETNCYMDVIIELLHARGDEPLAAIGSTVRLDFEGDQWTFFKPDPGDLERLFGIDIHEMQPWRPIPIQIVELLETGRTLTVELDAWLLPDTAATSYRTEHVKTTVIPEAIDIDGERLRYFHNGSLYELGGDDFRGLFRLDGVDPAMLPPYTELVRFDAGTRLRGDALRSASLDALRHHLAHAPSDDPFGRFGRRLAADLPGLLEGDAATYHAYAFATVRMAGAGFELLGSHVEWLLGPSATPATDALGRVVEGAKLLGFRLARQRPFDPEPIVADMSLAWDEAITALHRAVD
jgi:uncharacterized protein DUF1839